MTQQFFVSQMIVLIPTSIKGKNRLNELKAAIEAGNLPTMVTVKQDQVWRIDQICQKVIFSTDPGPWLMISPEVSHAKTQEKFSRWVKKDNDAHFIVIPVEASLKAPLPYVNLS